MFSMGLGQKNVNKNKIVPFEIPSILRLNLARGHCKHMTKALEAYF